MNDENTTENTEAEQPKEEKPQLAKANGVSQPRAGTKTRRVWDIADEISKSAGRPAFRKEVLEQCDAEGIVRGTAATQYGKWCTFHGLDKDALSEARRQQAEKDAANAPAGETEQEEQSAE